MIWLPCCAKARSVLWAPEVADLMDVDIAL